MRFSLHSPVLVIGLLWLIVPRHGLANSGFVEDFDTFCAAVTSRYAYFDQRETDWPAACAAHRSAAASAVDRQALLAVLERTLGELYDAHAHFSVSNRRSARLVPTDTDVHAEWRDTAAWITDVRPMSAAAAAGLRAGQRLLAIDGHPIIDAVALVEPRHLRKSDPAARHWALQVALAGRQDRMPVRLRLLDGAKTREVSFVPGIERPATPLAMQRLDGDIGLVRINNTLGDTATIAAFDNALAQLGLRNLRGLVLDLRDTPSGGNSLVARGIMGRLISKPAAYQTHELVAEQRAAGVRRTWTEWVHPRGTSVQAPVVVLVGRWTGSMGEGLAIGLHAARGARVIGTPMAGLLGALGEERLAHSGITLRIPVEKLFHVDGTPREAFRPEPVPATAGDADPALSHALTLFP